MCECACVLATWVKIHRKVGIGGGKEETSVQHFQPTNGSDNVMAWEHSVDGDSDSQRRQERG